MARTRNGSTPCASPAPSCGARTPTRRSPSPSTPSSRTLFDEPWQAQAVALASVLGAPTEGPFDEAWLAALERFVCARGLTDAGTLAAHRAAWARAAERTPHGTPIELAPADFS